MLSELNHIQEAMQQLQKHTNDPFGLPLSSEQVSCITPLNNIKLVNTDNLRVA